MTLKSVELVSHSRLSQRYVDSRDNATNREKSYQLMIFRAGHSPNGRTYRHTERPEDMGQYILHGRGGPVPCADLDGWRGHWVAELSPEQLEQVHTMLEPTLCG